MRPIDADTLQEQVKELEYKCRSMMCFSGEYYLECLRGIQKIIEEAPAIVPPPNPPLSLEELREMDGEPVWISPAKENGKVPARWMLISGYNLNKDIYLFAPSCNITQGYDGKSYGKTWLAYRRKPEEG